ncbi:hypothetical protein EJ110_NYTH57908 [Nymphaea thermarum]|nr:hypothetical protein EJ110_NYTH57908 [Nymphaea thermarum]
MLNEIGTVDNIPEFIEGVNNRFILLNRLILSFWNSNFLIQLIFPLHHDPSGRGRCLALVIVHTRTMILEQKIIRKLAEEVFTIVGRDPLTEVGVGIGPLIPGPGRPIGPEARARARPDNLAGYRAWPGRVPGLATKSQARPAARRETRKGGANCRVEKETERGATAGAEGDGGGEGEERAVGRSEVVWERSGAAGDGGGARLRWTEAKMERETGEGA